MTGQLKPITKKCLERIEAFHRGDLSLPQWLTDWNERLENARISLEMAAQQGMLSPEDQQRYIEAVVNMMHRKDRLYSIWLNELPFKTWEDLAAERPPSADDLFRHAVEDTEDYLNGPGVPAFVLFLNQRWPGFMKDFTQQCLRECDPLLEESLELTPDIRRHLAYPEQAFATTNKEVLETKMSQWAKQLIPPKSPSYVLRLLVANVMASLGNELGACLQTEFARCEAAEPDFAELMLRQDPQIEVYLKQTQRWQIDVLLSLWPN